jgi:hypothetical protein
MADSFADFSDYLFGAARFNQHAHYNLAASALTQQAVALTKSKPPRNTMRNTAQVSLVIRARQKASNELPHNSRCIPVDFLDPVNRLDLIRCNQLSKVRGRSKMDSGRSCPSQVSKSSASCRRRQLDESGGMDPVVFGGKTWRRSHGRRRGGKALYLVSVRANGRAPDSRPGAVKGTQSGQQGRSRVLLRRYPATEVKILTLTGRDHGRLAARRQLAGRNMANSRLCSDPPRVSQDSLP